ncbi:predicted protein [Botrytis cinerea T4]|uniref:Uncharacterized protein n=1 Tax=Botryotinia fuckeliana (strain T4) TaxID=999810 RepID=G2YTR3_BOTF4|nr:predicted protein [Botrytis cinerea T4]
MAKVSIRCVPEWPIEVRGIDPPLSLKSGRVRTTSRGGKEDMRTLVLRNIPDHDELRLTTTGSIATDRCTLKDVQKGGIREQVIYLVG